jgi:hypothetical protein
MILCGNETCLHEPHPGEKCRVVGCTCSTFQPGEFQEVAHGGMKEEIRSFYEVRHPNGKVSVSNNTPTRLKWKARIRNLILFWR